MTFVNNNKNKPNDKHFFKAMWMMLQQDKPEDYVIATGKSHSVREFVEESFKYVGISVIWEGEGVDEIGRDKETKKILVRVNPKYFRPTEVVSIIRILLLIS